MKVVKDIIEDVKKNGDTAVFRYTMKFDKINTKSLEISRDDIKNSYKKLKPEKIKTFEKVISRLSKFAKKQMSQYKDFEFTNGGVTLGQRVVPIENIGVYVPSGNYPLPSTALMCIVPAKIAGVENIIVCSPKTSPETIVAADMAGADKIYRIGGVQAIAAMAYGTETIPKVKKIVGPGNVYVTAAKKEVYGICGIDFIAGPSELLIIADKNANPRFVAADMIAQAEHDVNAVVILFSDSQRVIKDVEIELGNQIKDLGTKDIAGISLKNKQLIKTKSLEEAVAKANEIAPEHIELVVKNPNKYVKSLKNYGSLFVGNYSATAFGDYCSGTNHVLPTNGAAKYSGGLSVRDFIKIQTYQSIDKEGARKLSKTAADMARMEGLEAHEKSVVMRK